MEKREETHSERVKLLATSLLCQGLCRLTALRSKCFASWITIGSIVFFSSAAARCCFGAASPLCSTRAYAGARDVHASSHSPRAQNRVMAGTAPTLYLVLGPSARARCYSTVLSYYSTALGLVGGVARCRLRDRYCLHDFFK